ncbi:endo-1,3(4)-beta-glucanase [Trichophaea hybrida]|nr:endo-1,3(4)-beta-glucanase [Trichophaea hybrida]
MSSIFDKPISTDAPLSMFNRKKHPVSREVVIDNPEHPVETNTFYTNALLPDSQRGACWTLPYLVTFLNGTENPEWCGMVVSHAEKDKMSMGPDPKADPVQFYINPPDIKYFVFSAAEFKNKTTTITVDSTSRMSVNLNIHADRAKFGDLTKKITFPLVQGMGLVTAQYSNLVPVMGSEIFFQSVNIAPSPRMGIQKYRIKLEDNRTWLMYVIPSAGSPEFQYDMSENRRKLLGRGPFTGIIQIAKVPDNDKVTEFEPTIDLAAGAYPTGATLDATVDGNSGSYTFNFIRQGDNNARKLLMFALPHHVDSFDSRTLAGKSNLQLRSPSKGMMLGFFGDSWTMQETNLPTHISWLPNAGKMNDELRMAIYQSGSADMQQDLELNTDDASVYFAGKSLARLANLVLAFSSIDIALAESRKALDRLKKSMDRWTSNKQKHPLVYDETWKGIISNAYWDKKDPGADFGGPFYNDFGYHIYTAAAIVDLDRILNNNSDWLNKNRDWVNNLIRNVANPSTNDPYFPVSRSFDWFHGHSWAKGLFWSGDGKDQESSSEDYNFAFAMKLWGMVTGDAAMEARGNLMLGILKRTVNEYMLLGSDNKIHPAEFIKNMVSGILFENKCDHATYFGNRTEYIQGIHMIPLTAISPYIRRRGFVKAEWERYFDNGRAENADKGWKSILFANYAIANPKVAYEWFRQDGFDQIWLDGGLSRTWAIAFSGCEFIESL